MLAGFVKSTEMKKYLSVIDVLVHPTYREGFGMVIQEAGALALPIITTDIPGASEVMIKDESALIVEPKNERALRLAMEKIAKDNKMRESIGQSAYVRTLNLYGRDKMLKNLSRDYEKICGED